MKYLISKHEIEFEHQTNLHKIGKPTVQNPMRGTSNIQLVTKKKVFKKENGQKKLNKKKIF